MPVRPQGRPQIGCVCLHRPPPKNWGHSPWKLFATHQSDGTWKCGANCKWDCRTNFLYCWRQPYSQDEKSSLRLQNATRSFQWGNSLWCVSEKFWSCSHRWWYRTGWAAGKLSFIISRSELWQRDGFCLWKAHYPYLNTLCRSLSPTVSYLHMRFDFVIWIHRIQSHTVRILSICDIMRRTSLQRVTRGVYSWVLWVILTSLNSYDHVRNFG